MRAVVTFKAFGDFLIILNVTRSLILKEPNEAISVIAAPHVRQLAIALKIPDNGILYFSDGLSSDVPAIFDIKRRGFFAAFQSLRNLRRQINFLSPDTELIFDNLGWRETLIAGNRNCHQLSPMVNNVYMAYDSFFESLGYELSLNFPPSLGNMRHAIIVPGARMDFRVIPSLIISNIYDELSARGFEVEVVLLEGEVIDVPRYVKTKVIPKSFTALIDSINNSDLVVSADSMPSHLSAFLKVPIFVFSPMPEWTSYWLPKTAYLSQGIATFSNIQPFRVWLDKKLNS
jgi:hypothetical protein